LVFLELHAVVSQQIQSHRRRLSRDTVGPAFSGSCIFHPAFLVLHFQLLHFPVLNFQSRIFQYHIFGQSKLTALVPHFPVLHFPCPHFQRQARSAGKVTTNDRFRKRCIQQSMTVGVDSVSARDHETTMSAGHTFISQSCE